jgi:hypothetical protein
VGEKGYVLELSNKIATEITLLLHKMIWWGYKYS